MRNGASWLAVKLFFIEMGQEESKAPVERPQVEVEVILLYYSLMGKETCDV